jgi:pyocin large subunit-like protein
MSRQATEWAAGQRLPKAADKAVLWSLADACNKAGWDAFPSVAAIGLFTSLNRKQVIASLHRLEACGWIADTGRRVGKTRQVKVYRINPKEYPIGDA